MVSSNYILDKPEVHKKLVIVGDGGCGKSCLLLAFARNKVPDTYVPTIFETYSKNLEVSNINYNLSLFDTAGQDAYDRLRPLTYPDADVVLICFSADSPDSLYNAYDKWTPEIKHFCPFTPIVVICTKVDLRNDEYTIKKLAKTRQEPIQAFDGLKLARFVKAASYVECSSKSFINIKEVFIESARSLNPKYKSKLLRKKKQCVYL